MVYVRRPGLVVKGRTHLSCLQELNVICPYVRTVLVMSDVVESKFIRLADDIPHWSGSTCVGRSEVEV